MRMPNSDVESCSDDVSAKRGMGRFRVRIRPVERRCGTYIRVVTSAYSPALSDGAGLNDDVRARALDARDARFDGLFFVGITTTRIYCRPVCPARVSYHDRRRFFESAAAAERAGFRPCLRCRPELAPGRALVDAVPRLAGAAAQRIAAGALNGRGVAALARELGVSGRHLRRVMEHELGVSPVELAQTHRLLLAKQLLADTALPVTRVAYASGFQSLRRFNAAFRAQYRMPPTALRRPRSALRAEEAPPENELLRLTLGYRAPFAWDALLDVLRHGAIPGVETICGRRYGRTVRLEGRTGYLFVEGAAPAGTNGQRRTTHGGAHLNVHVSPSLVPVLMPLLARLRRLFDLDAEPTVVDAHLENGGLGALVRRRPGLRLPGVIDGFELAFHVLLRGRASSATVSDHVRRVMQALGEPLDTGVAGLERLAPTPERVAAAGGAGLIALGVPPRRAEALARIARLVAEGALRLEPGRDAGQVRRALLAVDGVGDQRATTIVMRALSWPDAFAASDRALQRAAGVSSSGALLRCAERWRPWRAYAAHHLLAPGR
jgi:AraC family transcriptional regulator, regulatory protein of adaptative response / DNA-3-methyladenine glycosylase II